MYTQPSINPEELLNLLDKSFVADKLPADVRQELEDLRSMHGLSIDQQDLTRLVTAVRVSLGQS